MKPIITADQMRAAEEQAMTTHPDVDLMQQAATALAKIADEMCPTDPVLIVAGAGNNGGDALYAAAQLAGRKPVWLWLVKGRAHAGGLAAAQHAGAQLVDAMTAIQLLVDVGLVIDGVAGLSSRPGLQPEVATFAQACIALAVPVLSVDLPSGLAADQAVAHPSFQASRTVTFAALKPCHVFEPSASRCGQVNVVPISVELADTSLRRAEVSDIAAWVPTPNATSDKYSRGVVALDVGSPRYPGAALLSCAGALYSGAGMVRYLGGIASDLVLNAFPSVVIGVGRAQAVVVGSGWGDRPDGARRLAQLQAEGVPVVADADALRWLPDGDKTNWLLTPHAGELARLLGTTRDDVVADPLQAVRTAASQTETTVLLKGATQYVAEPSGRVTLAVPGPSWTAVAGSGDVLAGSCGALLAAGLEPWRAAVVAASLQALTAQRHRGPYPPDELARRFPQVIAELGT